VSKREAENFNRKGYQGHHSRGTQLMERKVGRGSSIRPAPHLEDEKWKVMEVARGSLLWLQRPPVKEPATRCQPGYPEHRGGKGIRKSTEGEGDVDKPSMPPFRTNDSHGDLKIDR